LSSPPASLRAAGGGGWSRMAAMAAEWAASHPPLTLRCPGAALPPQQQAAYPPPLSQRVWASFVLLLVDVRPPWQTQPAETASADAHESPAFGGGGGGASLRLPPIVTARRVAVLEAGPKPDAQARCVQLSQDPVSGYAVAAAVGPISVGAAASDAGVAGACARLVAAARRRIAAALESRECLAKCDELGEPAAAAVAGLPTTAAKSYTEREEESLLRHSCPQVLGVGECEYSALAGLEASVANRDALTEARLLACSGGSTPGRGGLSAVRTAAAATGDATLPALAASGGGAAAATSAVPLLEGLAALPPAALVHVYARWLRGRRRDGGMPEEPMSVLAAGEAAAPRREGVADAQPGGSDEGWPGVGSRGGYVGRGSPMRAREAGRLGRGASSTAVGAGNGGSASSSGSSGTQVGDRDGDGDCGVSELEQGVRRLWGR